MPRGSGERDHIPDIVDAGDEHQQTLEAQPESGMRDGAVFPQIRIPAVGLGIDVVVLEIFQKHIVTLLPLRAADDLADARHEQIHRGDGFAVLVEAHVEGFDLLGVVENGGGLLEILFREPALVLGLEVQAVGDGVLEIFPRSLQ